VIPVAAAAAIPAADFRGKFFWPGKKESLAFFC